MELDDSVAETSEENIDEVPELNTRTLRKRRSLLPEVNKPTNRRVNMKPRKHILTENASPKQIEALYLNKKIQTTSRTLETIFEESKPNSTTETFIGGRKIKRLLTFQLGNQYTKERIKKRRAKIKKLLGNQSFLNRKKIPMQVFLKTIECLELDEPILTGSVPPSTEANMQVPSKK